MQCTGIDAGCCKGDSDSSKSSRHWFFQLFQTFSCSPPMAKPLVGKEIISSWPGPPYRPSVMPLKFGKASAPVPSAESREVGTAPQHHAPSSSPVWTRGSGRRPSWSTSLGWKGQGLSASSKLLSHITLTPADVSALSNCISPNKAPSTNTLALPGETALLFPETGL